MGIKGKRIKKKGEFFLLKMSSITVFLTSTIALNYRMLKLIQFYFTNNNSNYVKQKDKKIWVEML